MKLNENLDRSENFVSIGYCYNLRIIYILFFLLLISGFNLNCTRENAPAMHYNRIVSLAPSITETLFALDVGDRVVGVTRFCDYPEEAKKIAKVGGYFDPNYEAILALKPDLVVLLKEQETSKEYFNRLGIKCFTVNHQTINGNLHSIDTLGKYFGKEESAQKISLKINRIMESIRSKTRNLTHPSVLMTIGRSLGEIKNLFVVGNDEYYNEMISIAGGVNAFTNAAVRYPTISFEGIMQINPDIIIEIISEMGGKPASIESYRKTWDKFNEVKAVQANRIYFINESYAVRPGPRFILLIQDLAKLLHPEIPWGNIWQSLK